MLKLKLKLQYFVEKTLMLGKIGGWRRRGRQRMRWLDDITESRDMSLGNLWKVVRDGGSLVCCNPWSSKESYRPEQLN